jgi:translation initiation factor 2A
LSAWIFVYHPQVATWQHLRNFVFQVIESFTNFLVNDGTKQHLNMTIWRVDNSKPSSLGAFCHKTQNTWMPQWTSDESHIARQVSNEVLFYKAEVLDRVAFRIAADNIGAFALSSGAYPKAAVFIKEAKGLPAAVKVFLLPSTSAPVAQKMFFKADRCSLHWSPSGKHLLAMAQTDVDSTGVSYYGETHLYFISGDGSFDCRVELDKEGPIHDFTWSPRSDEFIVCYGCKSLIINKSHLYPCRYARKDNAI